MQTAAPPSKPRKMILETLVDFILFLLVVDFLARKNLVSADTLIRPTRSLIRRRHHVSLGSISDVVERKTGDQGQCGCGRGGQNGDIFRIDDLHLGDDVAVGSSGPHQFDDVIQTDVLEAAEKTVPVSSDSQITQLPDLGRAKNAAYSAIQCEIIRVVEHGHHEFDLGNEKNPEGKICLGGKADLVSYDSFGVPQREIRRGVSYGSVPRKGTRVGARRCRCFSLESLYCGARGQAPVEPCPRPYS